MTNYTIHINSEAIRACNEGKDQPTLFVTEDESTPFSVNQYTSLGLMTVQTNSEKTAAFITGMTESLPKTYEGNLKRIYLNKHHVKYNRKHKRKKPILSIHQGGSVLYCDKVTVMGESTLMYNRKALPCGANVYVETRGDIVVVNPTTFKETKNL